MCGLEALMLALKLGSEIAVPQYDTNARIFNQLLICDCSCTATESERLRCEADALDAKAQAIEKHNAKVKEFQQIARICGVPK